MKNILLLFTLCAFALPANAGTMTSIEDRADAMSTQLAGNNSYHAHLARAMANIAIEEKGQHDMEAARAFIKMADRHAASAGGAK